MLRQSMQFQTHCQSNLDSIKNPKRLKKHSNQQNNYISCVNNPMTQQFSNLRLASTKSCGRTPFYQQLEKMKRDYQVRTGYIRIEDKEVMNELYEINLKNMQKKYQKYANFDQLNIPKQMIKRFRQLGYEEITKFMQMAISHLLFENRSLLQYDNKWERDAIIALSSIAFIKLDCLSPQLMVISPDDEHSISIKVIFDHLNINMVNVYLVSNKNKIVDDRKYLREAQIVIGTADRLDYVIQQKYLTILFLDSVIFQEFSLTSDLGHCQYMKSIMNMLSKRTSTHFFYSQVFSEAEHDILDI